MSILYPISSSMPGTKPTTSNAPTVREIKNLASKNLRQLLGLSKTAPLVGAIAIKDEPLREFVTKGIVSLGYACVVLGEEPNKASPHQVSVLSLGHDELFAMDYFIYDNEFEGIDVVQCLKAGVVPIMPEANVFSGMLKPFDPMKFEGNGFFFSEKENPYEVFAKFVSYTENIRFPEDRRVLLKNVVSTF